MNEDLDRSFELLREEINRRHEEGRARLLESITAVEPDAQPVSTGRIIRRAVFQVAAATLVVAGLAGAAFLLIRPAGETLWAASDRYQAEATAQRQVDGAVWTRFAIRERFEENGKKDSRIIAEPSLTVRQGQSASISIDETGGRSIQIQQIFAKDADEVLIVVVIQDGDRNVVWTTALTVSIDKRP